MEKENLAGFSGSARGARANNCGVTAVSVITRTPFKEVFSHIRREGGHSMKWSGKTTLSECKAALKHFGKEIVEEIKLENSHITLMDWHRNYAKPDTTYFIGVVNHWLTYRNGEVFDQGTNGEFKPVGQHWPSLKKMWLTVEIK